MSLKRVVVLAVACFGIFFLVQSPAEAARLVKVTGENAGDWLQTAAHSMSQFLKTLI
jgi:hypothetical protein